MNQLKIIKFIVFMLTFMLFFGIIYAGIILLKRNNKPTPNDLSSTGTLNLSEPQGTEIKQISPAENGLYIWVRGGNQPERIIFFDPQKMQKTFIININ